MTLAATLATAPSAEARHHHHSHHVRAASSHRVVFRIRHAAHSHAHAHIRQGGGYVPPFASYAVDGNSGRVLNAEAENELRHPASLTKVMTLYLLFEQLEKKRLSLDSELTVSQHAAAQEPTKLGLRPGSHIRVEDAIKAIVTKSANDMAVAVAEQIGGDEENFARLMTKKAHMLGMSRTLYRNASGLPNDEQWTTAKDLVALGRAIHDRFPHYYHFFSTPSFRYAGQFMPNHNHLMEQVEGMDGIKTGYTRASGFNLLTSVSRHGHYLVAVVLGGRTRLGRDHIMATMIDDLLDKCAVTRTASIVEENPALEQVAEAIPVVQHQGDNAPDVEAVNEDDAENTARARPAPVPTVPSTQVAALTSDVGNGRARPAFVPGAAQADRMATGSIRPRDTTPDASTSRNASGATPSPRALRQAAREAREAEERTKAAEAKAAEARIAEAKAERGKPMVKLAALEPQHAPEAVHHEGWMIQIGATDNLDKANALISRAKSESHGALGSAKPFTEKVQKGSATLYRARFAGLEANTAESACKALKHSGFACFATKN